MYGDPPGSCDPQLGYDLGSYDPLGPLAWQCQQDPECSQARGEIGDFAIKGGTK